MPRHQLFRFCAESPRQFAVHLRLHLRERFAGELFEFVEQGQQLFRVVLLEADSHIPEVVEPQLFGRLVPQLGQFDQLRCDDATDLLQRFPGLLPLRRVVFLAEHFQ